MVTTSVELDIGWHEHKDKDLPPGRVGELVGCITYHYCKVLSTHLPSPGVPQVIQGPSTSLRHERAEIPNLSP